MWDWSGGGMADAARLLDRSTRTGSCRLRARRGQPGSGRTPLWGERAHGLGLAEDGARGGPPQGQAARPQPYARGRPSDGAGRAGRGAKRRDLGRVRGSAGRTRGGPAEPRRCLPGAQGPGPGPEKKTLRAAEQDRADVADAREAWRADLAGIDPRRLVFVDETGIDTRMTRTR